MNESTLFKVLHNAGTILLESSRVDSENRRTLLFRDPRRILKLLEGEPARAFFNELASELDAGNHVAGYLAYELGHVFEPGTARPAPGQLLAWLGVYESPELLATPDWPDAPQADQHYQVGAPEFQYSREEYIRCIEAVRHHIHEGNVYQINFTGKMRFPFEGDPIRFYAALRINQPVSYGAVINLGNRHILSLSPELFFRIEGDRIIARPMKGTARRGRFGAEDAQIASWLRNDPKSRAENLMIVDLLRNDLSRVCREGSVTVPKLFEVERYPTVFQMTSTIEGRLRSGTNPFNVLQAIFPCGSVTGAPKIRAMQLISEIEKAPRGLYTGAIGYFAPNGDAAFNVAIRTVEITGGRGEMGVGSGIVWDSDAGAEYEECLLKAAFLAKPAVDFQLIETMRWEGGIALLDRHIHRLRSSARYFDFRFDEAAVRAAIEAAGAETGAGGAFRMRLLLFRSGQTSVTVSPIEMSREPWCVGFSKERVDSRNPLCFHKTTRREDYERAYEWARANGFDEALLLNERGNVTEGARTNVFIRNGMLWRTPPITDGLLAGVYRAHLLERLPYVEESSISPQDVLEAEEVILCNAVRGIIPAAVVSR